jgi:precorrin-6A/cobalt-precorrin-6A reductase
MTRLLILGGTGEAAALARGAAAGADLDVITSLAGRTAAPAGLPGRVRVGGFGAAAGLAAFLRAEFVDAVIDATHPFAARISAHAVRACAETGVPRLAVVRPPWLPVAGDRWIEAADMADAAARLPALGRHAFLSVGYGELAAFAGCAGLRFLVRMVEDRPIPLADGVVMPGRGPFRIEDEIALLRDHGIDVVVSKASGGDATYAKIAAARALSVPVVMIRRPPPPAGPAVATVGAALAWLADIL